MNKIIARPYYLDKLISYKDTSGLIKILTGIRRCGKSTLFELYKNYLLTNGINQKQIIYLNFEDPENNYLLEYEKLYYYILNATQKNKMNYIFLDEVQNVYEFQKAINGLRLKTNIDLYITGSNAYLLAGELATLLAGRYIKINIYPLSFKEYLSFYSNYKYDTIQEKIEIEKHFNNYIYNSSFPNTLFLKTEQIREYLNTIYESILFKDIIERKKITDLEKMKSIIMFIFDNIGSSTSINNIKNQILSDKFKIDNPTIENYLTALKDSFLLYQIQRYDIKGKQLLKTNNKYYVADVGLRQYLLGKKQDIDINDSGHILENIVFLELLRRGYDIYVGKVVNKEIDFIIKKGNDKKYIQVAERIDGDETRKRELEPLEMIRNNFEKIIISKNPTNLISSSGIKNINIMEWLLQ